MVYGRLTGRLLFLDSVAMLAAAARLHRTDSMSNGIITMLCDHPSGATTMRLAHQVVRGPVWLPTLSGLYPMLAVPSLAHAHDTLNRNDYSLLLCLPLSVSLSISPFVNDFANTTLAYTTG